MENLWVTKTLFYIELVKAKQLVYLELQFIHISPHLSWMRPAILFQNLIGQQLQFHSLQIYCFQTWSPDLTNSSSLIKFIHISLHCGWMKHAISFENPVGQQTSTIPLIELSFKKECNVEDKSMPLFLPNRIIVMHVMHFQFPSYWSFAQ